MKAHSVQTIYKAIMELDELILNDATINSFLENKPTKEEVFYFYFFYLHFYYPETTSGW